MKSKDDLILEQLYQEGILDRLGGQFKGVKAGGSQILQNLGRKIYQKAGGVAIPAAAQTAGQAYAKAQQKSLLDSFIKKTSSEIEDFKKDLLAMGVSGDPEEIKKTHPVIAQRIKQVESLLKYLKNPTSAPAAEAPAAEAPAAEAPAAEAPAAEAPAAEAPAAEAPAAEVDIPNETRITDKSGNVFEYDKGDKKWYIASKGGKSLTPIPNDSEKIQKIITNAWSKKTATPATEAPATEAPATEAPATEAPATTVPSIWLNTQQARDYLNITNKELWNLSKSGKIKAVKRPNGNYKFSRQALEKYKNSLSVSSESYNPFADFLKKYNLI
jgi:hypothetical protein